MARGGPPRQANIQPSMWTSSSGLTKTLPVSGGWPRQLRRAFLAMLTCSNGAEILVGELDDDPEHETAPSNHGPFSFAGYPSADLLAPPFRRLNVPYAPGP